MKTKIMALAFLSFAACNPSPPDFPAHFIEGIEVRIEPGSPQWVYDDSQTFMALKTSVEYAGGSLEDLKHWVVVFHNTEYVECGKAPDHLPHSAGCTWDNGWVDVPILGRDWVFRTSLVHEVVHTIIWDPCHTKPIWRDFSIVESEVPGSEAKWWREDQSC